jgi:hypothetical protein
MAGFNVRVRDLGVRDLLRDIPGELSDALRAGLNDVSALWLRDATDYPPPLRYVRTMTLFRSWSRLPITGQGLALRGGVGSNENMAPYNRQVQSADEQAPIHRGRWTPVEEIERNRHDTAQSMIDARIESVIRKHK